MIDALGPDVVFGQLRGQHNAFQLEGTIKRICQYLPQYPVYLIDCFVEIYADRDPVAFNRQTVDENAVGVLVDIIADYEKNRAYKPESINAH